MDISEFDYELPAELIAQEPLAKRDASRMLVLDRAKAQWTDSSFLLLTEYLKPSDILVVNNTRVFPARLFGQRHPSGGRVEVLLVREVEPGLWQALLRPGQRLKQEARIQFADQLNAEVLDAPGQELRLLKFEDEASLLERFEAIGHVPLPPYIKRPTGDSKDDKDRYQTIFARTSGAIAAPTAGLHFTSDALHRIRKLGTQVVEITLHVGYGTFEPVRVTDVTQHQVSPELFEISEAAAESIQNARREGRRIIAVGTTTTRALEAAARVSGDVAAGCGEASLTILPGYKFKIVDGLITNFHLPRSSLLLLVSAFAGRDLVLSAYRHAVVSGYRFYSYGDCMLVF